MFLDNTYFQGELSIPNLIFVEPKGVGTMIQAVNEQSFDWYLGKYEVKFMNELLGSEMYARMMKEIEDGNEWGKIRVICCMRLKMIILYLKLSQK